MVQELERRGARVACTYTGGLDFSVPVQDTQKMTLDSSATPITILSYCYTILYLML